MKIFLITVFFTTALIACGSIDAGLSYSPKSKMNDTVLKKYRLSDSTQLSVRLPKGGDFFGFLPETDLDQIDDYGRLLGVMYDKPRGIIRTHPHMFRISLNITRSEGENFLTRRGGKEKTIGRTVGDTDWTCDMHQKDVEGRMGKRWVCFTPLNEDFFILFNAVMNPWVRVKKDRFATWEAQFFAALDSLKITR